MRRVPEPELMEDEAQARAYAEADFEEPHAMCVRLCAEAWAGRPLSGALLDLGCGPADITVRLAQTFPAVTIDGVDGSEAMLRYGRERVRRAGLEHRVRLWNIRLPAAVLLRADYSAIVSNSLLHHLRDPGVLWRTIRSAGRRGAAIFVMDLLRPDDPQRAQALVDHYAGSEPEILRRDFHASLLAAYRIEEVRDQLAEAGLGQCAVRAVSDRHWTVHGFLS
jgi:cyclopropane fatty-acyl-phospholipid synthase-like methyltransferase